MKEKIFLASDHAGISLKAILKKQMESTFECVDLGPQNTDSVNYPDFASTLCKKVLENQARGILICGSGIGMSMSANRFKGIRAALCHDVTSAELSRKHNDSNVLCLGERLTGVTVAQDILTAWLKTPFEGGRHKTRVELMDKI